MNSPLDLVLNCSPSEAARALIGWTLISTAADRTDQVGGIICETEAYLPANDPAAHNRRGKTNSNRSLFREAGTLYVHQMRQHFLLDIVTEAEDLPGSVLVRGLKPTLGIDVMRARRGDVDIRCLCNGPGKLSKALGITKALDGQNLADLDCPLRLAPPNNAGGVEIRTSFRIGVTIDLPEPMRFHADWKDLSGDDTSG